MTLPTFIVIGAMKGGTTSLYHYLRAHPQVFMPRVKELDFFTEPGNWGRGLRWYERRFEAAPADARALGEASTNYTKFPHFPDVPERMSTVLPDAKLIYVIRDPVDRILSHYRHRVGVGSERRDIEEAVLSDPHYIDTSRYAMQAERYLRVFPREQLLIMTSESLKLDRAAAIERVYDFIGVDPTFSAPVHDQEFYVTSVRTRHSPLAWKIRRAIKRRFPAAKQAKEFVDGLFGRRLRAGPSSEELNIPDHVRAKLVSLLADDVARLREITDLGVAAWRTS